MLTVAVPTYRNMGQLIPMLHSLSGVDCPMQVIVVNNGPESDGDGNRFEDTLRRSVPIPDLKVIQADGNWGWAKSINRAFEAADETEFFLMANDDIVFLPWDRGILGQMARCLKFPDVVAVGPASNFVMGRQNFLDPTPLMFTTTLLIGFCMMVRSDAFAAVGGLDESLPGGDDLDLSILLRKAGGKLMVDKSKYVHHWGAQTGTRVHKNFWNSDLQVELTNNSLIRKHGFRWWYETHSALIDSYAPFLIKGETEKEMIAKTLPSGVGLDLGCGPEKTVDRAIGVDRVAQGQTGTAGGVRTRLSVADVVADVSLLDESFPAESQDYLIARHILEHMEDPWDALERWQRVLKPGGLLAVAVPNEDMFNTVPLDSTHKHAFNPRTLARILQDTGWTDIRVERVPGDMTVVAWARRAA